ncbi:MAG: trypsin-like serine protease [Deltaproteobacteria bacterium]|nr:trypsin-like serine protease [Deltaproteobacteria bacterium]
MKKNGDKACIEMTRRSAPLMMSIALLFTLISTLPACHAPGTDPSFARIYGGMPVPDGGFAAVVAVAIGDEPYPFCTGVLVSPTAVLTAGHCVTVQSQVDDYDANARRHRPSDLRVYVGNALRESGEHQRFSVRQVHLHPMLRASPIGYADYAILELSEPVAGVAPVRMVLDNAARIQALRRGQATLIGFGYRESSLSGEKYAVTTKLRSLNTAEVLVGGNGQDTCTGDSGGPALVPQEPGKLALLGIASRGLNLACGDGTVVELTSAAACWLSGLRALEDGPTSIAELAGFCPREGKRYADEELAATSFERLCHAPAAHPDQRASIAAIMQAMDTAHCETAAVRLQASNHLNLDGLNLRDLSPLAGLTHLRYLSLKGNAIRDLSSLRTLTNLVSLEVEGNDIRDVFPLPELVAKGLKIRGLKRQNWNHLDTMFRRHCRAMKAGMIDSETEHTVRALLWHASSDDCDSANARLLMRTRLNLAGRGLSRVGSLTDFTNLEHLDLQDNPLVDITPLSSLENLESLDLRDTKVVDTAPLDALVASGLHIWR